MLLHVVMHVPFVSAKLEPQERQLLGPAPEHEAHAASHGRHLPAEKYSLFPQTEEHSPVEFTKYPPAHVVQYPKGLLQALQFGEQCKQNESKLG